MWILISHLCFCFVCLFLTEMMDATDDYDSSSSSTLEEVGAELERAAHLAHYLSVQVQQATHVVSSFNTNSNGSVTTAGAVTKTAAGANATNTATSTKSSSSLLTTKLPPDTEWAGFVLPLAPRIRKVEGDTIRVLI